MLLEGKTLEKTEQITKEYLNNNEFAEFEQFYDYYIFEISNIKPGRIPAKNEIKSYLKKRDDIEYNEISDIFWPKHQKNEVVNTQKYENLNELFNWKVVISVSLISGVSLKDNYELEKDLIILLDVPNKKIYQSGPFLTISWELDSFYVEIKIRNTFLEISSYLLEKKKPFLDLLDYILQKRLNNISRRETILLFPQISGAFTAYQKLSNVFSTIYENSISFEINDIKIKKGNRS